MLRGFILGVVCVWFMVCGGVCVPWFMCGGVLQPMSICLIDGVKRNSQNSVSPSTRGTPHPSLIPLSSHCMFCHKIKNVDFVIFMQFLAILPKLLPKVKGLNFKGLFQKNPNRWGRGVEDKKFPRVLKKEHAEIPGG